MFMGGLPALVFRFITPWADGPSPGRCSARPGPDRRHIAARACCVPAVISVPYHPTSFGTNGGRGRNRIARRRAAQSEAS